MRMLIYIMLAVIVMAGSAWSRNLSLAEAVALATEHSRALKQAEAECDAAGEGVEAAKAARFPTLEATAMAFYNSEVASLELETPTGNLSREIGSKEHYQADVRLVQPLYTGGRIGAGIDAADAARAYREALVAAEFDRVAYMARVEYFGLYRADRSIEAASHSLRRVELVWEDLGAKYAAGAADSIDVLEGELAVTEASFRLEEAQHDRRAAEIRLLMLLGLALDETVILTETVESPEEPSAATMTVSRPELVASGAAIELRRASVARAKAGYLPTLSVYGGYSYGKPNLDLFNNTWNDYFTVGGRLEWSLNLGMKTSSEISQAKYSVGAAERGRDDLDEELTRGMHLAYESLLLAYRRYSTAQDRYEITSRNYDLAQARHREGALPSNRLLEIEATLSEAEASLAAARGAFYIAESAYLYAAGSDELTEGL